MNRILVSMKLTGEGEEGEECRVKGYFVKGFFSKNQLSHKSFTVPNFSATLCSRRPVLCVETSEGTLECGWRKGNEGVGIPEK